MDLLERIKSREQIQMWWKLRNELRRDVAQRLDVGIHQLDKFLYDPKLLTIEEYRKWWWRSKEKIKDPVTGKIEPHNEMQPYINPNGSCRVYNIAQLWSGVRHALHPPVNALPLKPEDIGGPECT